ncbi:MAG: L-threonylcarbamoyladenylate synthase, partial [Oscillospiraceae bacterium]|nr:L-threonylcarbamoyladenylate synthase [Oscillospiraceae bacterium]
IFTLIFRKKPNVADILTAGGDTVGVRCPAHNLTLRLLELCAKPLATPSANPSGLESPKTFSKVMEYFDGKIECAIDGGDCSVGVESTIVDMTQAQPRILRLGGLSREAIESVIHKEVL